MRWEKECLEKGLLKKTEPNKKKAEALLEEAIFNVELVEKGKSVHNFSFSQELLFIAYNKMQEA